MLKETLRALDSGILPQIGLIAFVVAFVLVVIYALTMNKKKREEAKQIPLEDDEIVTPPSDQTTATYEEGENGREGKEEREKG